MFSLIFSVSWGYFYVYMYIYVQPTDHLLGYPTMVLTKGKPWICELLFTEDRQTASALAAEASAFMYIMALEKDC